MSTTATVGSTRFGDLGGPSHLLGQSSLASSNHAPPKFAFGTRDTNWGKSIWSNPSGAASTTGQSSSKPMNDPQDTDKRDYRALMQNSESESTTWQSSRQQRNAQQSRSAANGATLYDSSFPPTFGYSNDASTSRAQITQPQTSISPTSTTFKTNHPLMNPQYQNRHATDLNSATHSNSPSLLQPVPDVDRFRHQNGNTTTRWADVDVLSCGSSQTHGSGSVENGLPDFTNQEFRNNNQTASRHALDRVHEMVPGANSSAWPPSVDHGEYGRTRINGNGLAARSMADSQRMDSNRTAMAELDSRLGSLGIRDRPNHDRTSFSRYTSTHNGASITTSNVSNHGTALTNGDRHPGVTHGSDTIHAGSHGYEGSGAGRPFPTQIDPYFLHYTDETRLQQVRSNENRQNMSNGLSSIDRISPTNQGFMSSHSRDIPSIQLSGGRFDPARTLTPNQQFDERQMVQAQTLQQMIHSQMRAQYPRAQYSYGFPYEVPANVLPSNVLPNYTNGLPPHHSTPSMPPLIAHPITSQSRPELSPGISLRSALLEEFKSSNGKTSRGWELKDIYDHIVEFSGDQQGSRLIQQKLEQANSEEKERVFRELFLNSLPLMTDVFGNYVIQKFFEHGDQRQKSSLATNMKGHVLHLSLQVYGCRVVQKALEHVLVEEQISMVQELDGNILRCVKDQNGNHVIQRAIERVPPKHIQFITNAFKHQIHSLAIHTYGCRVVQRLLEYGEESVKSEFLHELHSCAAQLIADQYGNYVTQHVLEKGKQEDRDKIIDLVKLNLMMYTKQKFASNVVEKSIHYGTEQQKRDIMLLFAAKDERGESQLPLLIKDQYGNYVIQRLLDELTDPDYSIFVNILEPEMVKAKRLVPNKHAEMVARKMHKFDPPYSYPNEANHHLLRPLRTDIPNVITPPYTVEEGRTPRSNSIPSTSDEILTNSSNDTNSDKNRETVKRSITAFMDSDVQYEPTNDVNSGLSQTPQQR